MKMWRRMITKDILPNTHELLYDSELLFLKIGLLHLHFKFKALKIL